MKVKQDNFASFMEIAQEMNIKGLAVDTKDQRNNLVSRVGPPDDTVEESFTNNVIGDSFIDDIESRHIGEEGTIKTEQLMNNTNETAGDIDLRRTDIVVQDENGYKSKTKRKHQKKTPDSPTNLHCSECGKTSSDKSNLSKHIKSQHQGIVYPCNVCDYKAKQTTHLKGHMKSKHSELLKVRENV